MSHIEVVRMRPKFTDERGEIYDLVEETVGHTGLITCKKGSIRGNHYHHQSKQFTYIVEGKTELRTKDPNDGSVESVILNKGDMAIIPAGLLHGFHAIEDTVCLDCNTLSREGTGYESDTVRVPSLF
ncbi:cupin domain-containing protein [Candidatus Peregrinibacteria bacterium]|nr:cupin domain-containing protein [Candidatus Peregrinibacteria bacterium]